MTLRAALEAWLPTNPGAAPELNQPESRFREPRQSILNWLACRAATLFLV